MHIPHPHLSRTSLQMFSGAAGLIAAFTSISLLFSLPGSASDALPGLAAWGRATIAIVLIGSAALAYTLLRFSLSAEEHATLRQHPIDTRKLR